MSALGPVRRVVTGHDGGGRAVLRSDDRFDPTPIPSGDAAFTLIWTTDAVPADNNDDREGRERDAGLTINKGSVIRVVDMLPRRSSPFHRSNSIDYGIVLSGCVELELDDGGVTRLGAGDIVVQRGTAHLWRNPSDDTTARIVFVLIEAEPCRFEGRDLPEIHP